jgi:hypothetical protein
MTLSTNQIAAIRDVESTWPNATPTLGSFGSGNY